MKNRNTITIFTAILIALVCFALLPGAQAVVPAPDGGYANFTTAEGTNALKNLTTGSGNTGVGWYSLFSDTTGSFNTGVATGTLVLNTGDENTAVGAGALLSNTTGDNNTANGAFALFNNTTGDNNTANGVNALFSNTTGTLNTAFGAGTLISNTTGTDNTGVGVNALFSNVDGNFNTALGSAAMGANTSGGDNTAVGWFALSSNIAGIFNTANGFQALKNTTGSNNTATGADALLMNTAGIANTADGNNALRNNTGGGNTAIGFDALMNNIGGDNNIALGQNAGSGVTSASGVICIGAAGNDVDNSCYIGNIFGDTSSGGIAVLVNTNGRLGTTTSSRRFKEDIKPMAQASEALLALKPVTFRYKKEIDPQRISQFGLVAEEVEKVDPDLVVRDKEGKPYSVRYDQVNAMLLNEFLKAHRKIQEQEATITQLRKSMETVVAHLKEQDSKIPKVSNQIEINKAGPGVVRNDPGKVESQ